MVKIQNLNIGDKFKTSDGRKWELVTLNDFDRAIAVCEEEFLLHGDPAIIRITHVFKLSENVELITD